jgi:hypothetical protein
MYIMTSSDNAARLEEALLKNAMLEKRVCGLEAELRVSQIELHFEIEKLIKKPVIPSGLHTEKLDFLRFVKALYKTCRRVSAAIKDIDDPRLDQAKRDLGKVLSGDYGKDCD